MKYTVTVRIKTDGYTLNTSVEVDGVADETAAKKLAAEKVARNGFIILSILGVRKS